MTKSPDVREVLEAAFNHLFPTPLSGHNNSEWGGLYCRFTRFLAAEAYADAALMLVPAHCRIVTMTEHLDRQGWYVKLAIHEPHEALEAVSAESLPLAICEAALRAKGPGHEQV